jgi:hypothetical protein
MDHSTRKISKSAAEKIQQKIHPIAEFFELDQNEVLLDTSHEDKKKLAQLLRKSKGIYAFYNSEAEVIYVGKTKTSLWTEMKNAYGRRMNHYTRFFVNHPKKFTFEERANGKTRQIERRSFSVWNVATFFSAYHVEDDDLIDIIEMMMIRMMPNDLINVRMEGNTTLRSRTLGYDHG